MLLFQEPSRLPIPNYVDPYSAAVMGGYQQGTQNVVYPYQQHEGSGLLFYRLIFIIL